MGLAFSQETAAWLPVIRLLLREQGNQENICIGAGQPFQSQAPFTSQQAYSIRETLGQHGEANFQSVSISPASQRLLKSVSISVSLSHWEPPLGVLSSFVLLLETFRPLPY